MHREDTRNDYSCEEDGEYERARNRYREGSDRLIDGGNQTRNISYKKEHKRTSSPEEVVVDEVYGFPDFFPARDTLVRDKSRQDKLDIRTSP